MADKGAIDLVVQKNALDQVDSLNSKLATALKSITAISNSAVGSKGGFKNAGGKSSTSKQLSDDEVLTKKLAAAKDRLRQSESNLGQEITRTNQATAKNNKAIRDGNNKTGEYSKKIDKVTNAKKRGTKATNESTKAIRRNTQAVKQSSSRVGSFFKTLIQFDLARRGVQLFWDAFTDGFQALQTLDSVSLQLKFLVKDSQEILITQGFLARVSEDLGVEMLKLSESYLAFRKSAELANLSASDSRQVFEEVTKAASLLGKSDAEIHNVQVALEQMLSKGTVQAEELKKQLGNVLPGSFEIMALAVQELNPDMEVTNREFGKMLKQGKIIASEVLPEFARQLTKAYGVENVTRITTMKSEVTRLGNAFTGMIANIENGTGVLSRFVLLGTAILTAMVEEFGNLFLSMEQINESAKKLNFEKGFKEGIEQIDVLKKKYGELKDDIRTPIGWEVTFELEKIQKTKKEIAEIEEILTGIKSGDATETKPGFFEWIFGTGDTAEVNVTNLELKLQALNGVLGTSEGYVKGLTSAFEEQKKVLPEEEVEELKKVYNGLIPILQRAKKALLEIQKDETDADVILELSKSMDALGKSVKFLETGDFFLLKDLTDEQLEPLLENLRETNPEMAYLIKNLREMGNLEFEGVEKVKEQVVGLSDAEQMMIDVLDASASSLNSLADTVNNIFEKRIIDLEYEMDKIQEKYDLQKELIEAEVGDEESKAEALKQLQKEKEINEKIIQKKIAKEKEKQFRVDQAAAIATIGIQTAIGIISSLSTFPGPVGIALAALVGATGIASTIAVASEPVPKFALGHLAGTHSGLAMVNDGGVPEVIERKDGTLEMSSVRNQLINMSRGDRVHKNFGSFIDQVPGDSMMDKLNQASVMASLSISKHALDGVKADRQFNDSLKGILSSEIKKGFKRVQINNDNSSVGKAVAQALANDRYENNFL